MINMLVTPFSWRLHSQRVPAVYLSQEQSLALEQFQHKLKKNLYSFERVPCLCGQPHGKLIATRDRYGLRVDTYLCRVCGVMWTNPRMTQESLFRFYENDYRPIYGGEPKASEEFFADQTRHGARIFEFVSPNLASIRAPTVFDVGCGAGGALTPFRDAACLVYGCDLGAEYLERGRHHGLTLCHGDIASLGLYGPADLVILSHVLEHLPDPIGSLKKISEYLSSDGYIYVELPGIFSISQTYGDIMRFLQNAHLYHFTLATLSSVMSRAGYRLVKGNERIQALFHRDESALPVDTTLEYRRILSYFFAIERQRIFEQYPRLHKPWTRLMTGVRFVFGDALVCRAKKMFGWTQ